tara:strand:- start:3669 stop:3893 length:225 start_codon:yes stop_codon:yes gene_type:complete
MTALESKLKKDMLYYEAMGKDKERFPRYGDRYEFEKVAQYIKTIIEKFDFVDMIRNEENLPDVIITNNKHYGDK